MSGHLVIRGVLDGMAAVFGLREDIVLLTCISNDLRRLFVANMSYYAKGAQVIDRTDKVSNVDHYHHFAQCLG